ncbi:MAG: biotin carboxylase N-terminal domain-containing protein [Myxococcota bacterium]|jgi:acetyl/propionyl-CoA carboxylase alpha subunit|nr:biotin carboxylase N-terminal domain-containing protein [Myxococcota bacterium]
MRILIANRGEIARRIIRTAHALGHETVAVFADPDAEAPFVREATVAVRIGPAALAESYLDVDRLLDAAAKTGATAVHPGYGFLSESAAFAGRVVAAGLVWIGPHAEAIEKMGSKIEARRIAEAASVPTIPGYEASQDPADLERAADEIGYPVLVKAAAGGGGKGIRIVHGKAGFSTALAEAAEEAARSFGNAAVIVERFVERARHVEVQVVGDKHGNVVDLGTRECSVQRRYQKLLEEAPAPNLAPETIDGVRDAARKLTAAMHYDSTGTVEFVVDDATGDFYFLEMNTRLQVEHPVTEAITGLDLVAMQFESAAGEPLSIEQQEVHFEGHAIEVRINAEDAAADFAPQIGRVDCLRVPSGVRFDTGIEAGSSITPHYDAMVAKLIAEGPDRETARRKLAAALDELLIGGLVTNTGFQRWLIEQPPVVEGRVTTRFLDESTPPGAQEAEASAQAARTLAARAWIASRPRRQSAGPWHALGSFRATPHRPALEVRLEDRRGAVHEVVVAGDRGAEQVGPHLEVEGDGVATQIATDVDRAARRIAINLEGVTHSFRSVPRSEHWAPAAAEGHGGAGATVAPFPAIVTETPVAPGDEVGAGDVVIVIEAMKMLHSLEASGPGVVDEVRAVAGDSVESGQVLVTYRQDDDE